MNQLQCIATIIACMNDVVLDGTDHLSFLTPPPKKKGWKDEETFKTSPVVPDC